MKIRINSINNDGSIADGPGIRTLLYVQGCAEKCPGCHNPQTWDKSKGITRDTKDVALELKSICVNKKVTISGGEPLIQYEAVLELVKYLEDFDIALYTGFELERVPQEILKYLRYIKVGKFLREEASSTTPYIGSKNQKFIELRRSIFE